MATQNMELQQEEVDVTQETAEQEVTEPARRRRKKTEPQEQSSETDLLTSPEIQVKELEKDDVNRETDEIPEEQGDLEETGEDQSAQGSPERTQRELSIDEVIGRRSSRFAHELAKASAQERRERYQSEHVYTEYGDEEIETEATRARKDYLELVASSKSNKILEGTIYGYRYAGEERKSTILAEVDFGSGLWSVVIPSYLLYDYEVTQYVDPNRIAVIENNVARRIGAKVKFIVRHVNEKEQIAYADRLEAQSIIGYDNWIKPLRDGKPRLTAGLIVKGQVVMTMNQYAIVDSLGIEIRIPKEEISHTFVGDVREELHVGDYVNVRIQSVSEKKVEKNGTNYRLVDATGSIKDATPDHKKKLFDQFQVGGKYAGTITYIEDSGVFCRLKGDIDCLCALPRFGRNPIRNQKRVIKITEKDPERLFLYGTFINS